LHRSPITCIDHDPAAGRLVTGGYDGRVVAWAGGAVSWQVDFDDLVNDVRFSPDGTRVAVAVADRHAYVLDVADGSHVLALGPHGDDVNVVRWLPDGAGLVCVMDHLDTAVRVWRPNDGSWTATNLEGHASGVFGAAVDPAGRRLATAAEDRTARLWDLHSGAVLGVLDHPGDPEAIDWSPDGTIVATGCDDGICRLWDPDRGTVRRTLDDAAAAVRFVRFSADGRRLLVGAYDATMRVYDTATWDVVATHRHPMQWERAAVPVGDGVAIGSFGAEPVLHPATGTGPAPTFGINALTTTPSGDGVLVGRDDGAVVEVVFAAGRLGRARLLTRHESIVNTVAATRTHVASADYRGVVHVSPLDGGERVICTAREGGPVNAVVWSPDGTTFHTAGYDGVIRRWSADGRQLASWRAHHSPIKSLAWSRPTGLLVAGSSDGTLSAWRDGAAAWRAGADDLVLVNAVAADDAGVVVSASRDLFVRRWDAASGALVEALPRAHTKSVKAVATSADGSRLVTGAYDGVVVSWHRGPDGWRWQRLLHHGKPGVPAVGLQPGSASGPPFVLSAGWDGSLATWTTSGLRVDAVVPLPD
jgi:WD40 repeat protein